MVIDELKIGDIAAIEFKDEPQIAGHRKRPLPLAIAFQWVKPISGQVQIGRTFGRLQRGQQNAKPCRMLRIDSSCVAGSKEPLQPFVPDSLDHVV
jgi:hypothetical protein